MKSEYEIRRQLEEVYRRRLSNRVERYTCCMCRNCVNGISRDFDLGDFGSVSKWECKDGRKCGEKCGFECKWSVSDIEARMIKDISDPSTCGAKEPKIAMLMWVLHGQPASSSQEPEREEKPSGSWISRFFRRICGRG